MIKKPKILPVTPGLETDIDQLRPPVSSNNIPCNQKDKGKKLLVLLIP